MPLPLYKKPNLSPVRVFGIAAGKGGVGKSFLSCNVARALQKKGKRVALLDGDLYGPSLGKLLTVEQPATKQNGRWVPAKAEGIALLSLAHFCPEHEALSVRAPIASRLIDEFLNQTDWGPLDYLIIDFPPGTGDIQLSLAQKVRLEGTLLVTTPQMIAVNDVRRAAASFRQLGIPLIGLVENMSYFVDPSGQTHFPFGKEGGDTLSDELRIPLLARIPLEPHISPIADGGGSIFEPEQTLAQGGLRGIQDIFYKLADTLLEWQATQEIKKIAPAGPHAFQIEWSDGQKQIFDLCTLQKLCPCALCQGEGTSTPNVKAIGILEAGRYAIKIDFETGCKNGIYTYNFLKKQGRNL